MGLDSFRHPIRTYGDLTERIYSKWAARIVVAIQFVDVLFIIATSINLGSSWFEVAVLNINDHYICFPVACLVVTIIVICITQIRPLDGIKGIVVLSFLVSMIQFIVTLATSADLGTSIQVLNEDTNSTSPPLQPVHHPFGYPSPKFTGPTGVPYWVTGINTLSSSYWGKMLFTEFMAEMFDVADFGYALGYAWLWLLIQRLAPGIAVYK